MSQEKNTINQKKKQNSHLDFTERELIEKWIGEKVTKTEIAKRLGRDRSTIQRELKRGTTIQRKGPYDKKVEMYFADTGQAVYEKNRQNSCPKKKVTFSNNFFEAIELANDERKFTGKNREFNIKTFIMVYKKEKPEEHIPTFKTVYRYIHSGVLSIKPHDLPVMYRLAPRKNKHSRPKGQNKKKLGTSISKRPEDILKRKEFGHREADLVKGKRKKSQPAVLTLVERKTRYALTMKIKDYKSQTVFNAFEKILNEHSTVFRTITFDNGSEFSKASELETEQLDIYFAHAYASWERGSNEHFNGMLREYIPKGKSLHNYSKNYIQESTKKINERKRAILDGESAKTIFEKEIDRLKVS